MTPITRKGGDFRLTCPTDSEYGWEKLFSERLNLAFQRNYGINVKKALSTNFGPEGSWYDGRE